MKSAISRRSQSDDDRGYLPDVHRSLPQSQDAEKGVLCSALLSPVVVLGGCIERIAEDYFYFPAHQIIYREMIELQRKGEPVDFITLTQSLKDKAELDRAGGAAAISELFTFIGTASNADYYIDIVREKFLLRQLIQTCTNFASRGYDEQGEVKYLLDEFEQAALAIGAVNSTNRDTKRLRDILEPAIARYDQAYKHRDRSGVTGLTTGFPRLDSLTGGMLPEQMIVIGAREKHGKSAFAFNIAKHVGISLNKGVGIISLEMSERQIADRFVASHGRVNLTTLRDGTFSNHDMSRLSKAYTAGAKAPIFVREEADATPTQIRAVARRLRATQRIEILIVDYLQLIQPADRREKNRQVQISEISREMKLCAKELGIPVIVLSQLNKEGDTRESLSLQQDCDQMWKILRPKTEKQMGRSEEEEEDDSENWDCFLHIKFNREGETGRIPMTFRRPFTLFEERYA